MLAAYNHLIGPLQHGRQILFLIDNFDRVFPKAARGARKHVRADDQYRAFRKLLSTEGFLMVIGASVKLFEDLATYDQAFFDFFSAAFFAGFFFGAAALAICELLDDGNG